MEIKYKYFLTKLTSTRFSPNLEFANSRIKSIVLVGMVTTLEYIYSKF